MLLSGLVHHALRTEDALDIRANESPASLQWLSAVVWFFLLSSLAAVFAVAMIDIRNEKMERFAFKVIATANTILSCRISLTTLTTYYSLLTTHYSLLTTHSSLLTPHYSLLTTHYSLLTAHYLLLTTR